LAGVALGSFAWQAWHLWDWAGSLGVAGVAFGDIDARFATSEVVWQPWHLLTSTYVLHVLLLCLFDRNFAEAMFAYVAANCVQAMFGHVLLAHSVWLYLLLRHLVIYFWSGRFGSMWEEALCVFDRYFVEAMLACFCMFDRNLVEAMLACLACLACFALAHRGKRPCACLIETFWKRCWHVSHVSLWPNVGRGLVHV